MLFNTNLSNEAATLTKWLVSIPSVAHAKGPSLITKAIYEGLGAFPYFKNHPDHLNLLAHEESAKSSVVALVKSFDAVEDTLVILCDTDTNSPYHYGVLKRFSTNCDELQKQLAQSKDITNEELKKGIESDSLMFGLGILQSKCATGSMLVALKELSDNHVRLKLNILFICTSESAIQHRGIKKCIPFVQDLINKEHLKLRLCVNAKPNFPVSHADKDVHIYTGNYGKVEPSFYIIGNSASAFRPYSGFSASIIASELIRELELNPAFSQSLHQKPLVPTFDSLRVKEFGKDYSPDGMQISFSMPLVNISLDDVLELLKNSAAKAIENAAELLDQREATFARLNHEEFIPMAQDAEVVSFSDLLERASHNFTGDLDKALQGMILKCRSEGLSLHQAGITIIERLNELAKLPRPSIVVYFTDNYVPTQGLSASSSQDRELFMILDGLINKFSTISPVVPTMASHYAPADSGFTRPVNLNSSLNTLSRECPVGIEAIEGLDVPTITIGIKGDHLTLLTEHVDKSMCQYLPAFVLSLADAIANTPENSLENFHQDDLQRHLDALEHRAELLAGAAIDEAQQVHAHQSSDDSFYSRISKGTLEPESLDTFLKQQNKGASDAEYARNLNSSRILTAPVTQPGTTGSLNEAMANAASAANGVNPGPNTFTAERVANARARAQNGAAAAEAAEQAAAVLSSEASAETAAFVNSSRPVQTISANQAAFDADMRGSDFARTSESDAAASAASAAATASAASATGAADALANEATSIASESGVYAQGTAAHGIPRSGGSFDYDTDTVDADEDNAPVAPQDVAAEEVHSVDSDAQDASDNVADATIASDEAIDANTAEVTETDSDISITHSARAQSSSYETQEAVYVQAEPTDDDAITSGNASVFNNQSKTDFNKLNAQSVYADAQPLSEAPGDCLSEPVIELTQVKVAATEEKHFALFGLSKLFKRKSSDSAADKADKTDKDTAKDIAKADEEDAKAVAALLASTAPVIEADTTATDTTTAAPQSHDEVETATDAPQSHDEVETATDAPQSHDQVKTATGEPQSHDEVEIATDAPHSHDEVETATATAAESAQEASTSVAVATESVESDKASAQDEEFEESAKHKTSDQAAESPKADEAAVADSSESETDTNAAATTNAETTSDSSSDMDAAVTAEGREARLEQELDRIVETDVLSADDNKTDEVIAALHSDSSDDENKTITIKDDSASHGLNLKSFLSAVTKKVHDKRHDEAATDVAAAEDANKAEEAAKGSKRAPADAIPTTEADGSIDEDNVANLIASSINRKIEQNNLASIDNPQPYRQSDIPLSDVVYADSINVDTVSSSSEDIDASKAKAETTDSDTASNAATEAPIASVESDNAETQPVVEESSAHDAETAADDVNRDNAIETEDEAEAAAETAADAVDSDDAIETEAIASEVEAVPAKDDSKDAADLLANAEKVALKTPAQDDHELSEIKPVTDYKHESSVAPLTNGGATTSSVAHDIDKPATLSLDSNVPAAFSLPDENAIVGAIAGNNSASAKRFLVVSEDPHNTRDPEEVYAEARAEAEAAKLEAAEKSRRESQRAIAMAAIRAAQAAQAEHAERTAAQTQPAEELVEPESPATAVPSEATSSAETKDPASVAAAETEAPASVAAAEPAEAETSTSADAVEATEQDAKDEAKASAEAAAPAKPDTKANDDKGDKPVVEQLDAATLKEIESLKKIDSDDAIAELLYASDLNDNDSTTTDKSKDAAQASPEDANVAAKSTPNEVSRTQTTNSVITDSRKRKHVADPIEEITAEVLDNDDAVDAESADALTDSHESESKAKHSKSLARAGKRTKPAKHKDHDEAVASHSEAKDQDEALVSHSETDAAATEANATDATNADDDVVQTTTAETDDYVTTVITKTVPPQEIEAPVAEADADADAVAESDAPTDAEASAPDEAVEGTSSAVENTDSSAEAESTSSSADSASDDAETTVDVAKVDSIASAISSDEANSEKAALDERRAALRRAMYGDEADKIPPRPKKGSYIDLTGRGDVLSYDPDELTKSFEQPHESQATTHITGTGAKTAMTKNVPVSSLSNAEIQAMAKAKAEADKASSAAANANVETVDTGNPDVRILRTPSATKRKTKTQQDQVVYSNGGSVVISKRVTAEEAGQMLNANKQDTRNPSAPTAIAGSTSYLERSAEQSIMNQHKKLQEDNSVPTTIVVRGK